MKADYDRMPVCRPYKNNAAFVEFSEDWFFTMDGKAIWIPKDYYFNGASIPRVFWAIIGSPFEPDYWAGSAAHDFIYLTHIYDRSTADEILFQLLRRAGVGLWRARTIWAAVRAGGWVAWGNKEADKIELGQMLTEIAGRPDRDKFNV